MLQARSCLINQNAAKNMQLLFDPKERTTVPCQLCLGFSGLVQLLAVHDVQTYGLGKGKISTDIVCPWSNRSGRCCGRGWKCSLSINTSLHHLSQKYACCICLHAVSAFHIVIKWLKANWIHFHKIWQEIFKKISAFLGGAFTVCCNLYKFFATSFFLWHCNC